MVDWSKPIKQNNGLSASLLSIHPSEMYPVFVELEGVDGPLENCVFTLGGICCGINSTLADNMENIHPKLSE